MDDDEVEDEEDERPRKKRRHEDEDDEDVDEEDDRPRKKRRREEDEDEDDRPRKKKRRDEDDEDEDDRPRKKKKKGGNNKLILWLSIGGGAGVLVIVLVVVLILIFSGSPHENLIKETIGVMNELSGVLESVKDPQTAKSAATRIDSIVKKMEDIKKRSDALGKGKPEEEKSLKDKYEPELKKAMERFFKAGTTAMSNAGSEAQTIQKAFTKAKFGP